MSRSAFLHLTLRREGSFRHLEHGAERYSAESHHSPGSLFIPEALKPGVKGQGGGAREGAD